YWYKAWQKEHMLLALTVDFYFRAVGSLSLFVLPVRGRQSPDRNLHVQKSAARFHRFRDANEAGCPNLYRRFADHTQEQTISAVRKMRWLERNKLPRLFRCNMRDLYLRLRVALNPKARCWHKTR